MAHAGAIARALCVCVSRCYANSWLVIHGHVEAETPSYRYVVSLYFAVVTMTTTGYGDFYAHCSSGFLAVIVTVIAGMIVFAYALSVLAATLANTDAPKYAVALTFYSASALLAIAAIKLKFHWDQFRRNFLADLLATSPASS